MIHKLDNKGKILDIDEKIVSTELKIQKYESRRIITKKCIQEMENKIQQLQNKASQYPQNEKINDEIEDTQNRIKEGQRILKNLNEKLPRKEITLLKLKHEKRKEIKTGLIKYLDILYLKYENLQRISTDNSPKDRENGLKEIMNEIEHMKKLIEIETNHK